MALTKAQLEEKMGQLRMGLAQADATMNRTKPGTKEFNAASANYKAMLKTLNDYDAQLKALAKKEKADAAAKKKQQDLQKLADEKARLEARGQDTKKVDAKIDEVKSGKTPQQIADEKAKADAAAKAKADADAKAKADKAKADKAAQDKAAADKAAKDKAVKDKAAADKVAADNAVKTSYISALRETFKTLPKEYKSELDSLFAQAEKGAWDEKAFIAELQKTKWWNSSLPSLQAYFIESHDPRNAGTFAEKMRNKTDAISATLEKLGINATQVDPVTGKFYDNSKVIQGIASMALLNGWDDNQLMQHLGENAQLHFTGAGTIGSSVDTIKRQGLMYGINIDDNYLKQIQYSLLDPTDGRDSQYYLNELKNQAVDAYKPFAESLKAGRTLYEVTNNYRTKMANMLEIDPSNVTWKDLMNKVIDPTTGNARMESDFVKQLKQDPMWQYTKNAKETYSNMALDLMKQFGFVG